MAEVYLIDGAYYLYRALFAMRERSTSTGLPANATLCAVDKAHPWVTRH